MQTVVRTFTIPNGESLSEIQDCTGLCFLGFQVPAAWTTAKMGLRFGNQAGRVGQLLSSTAAAVVEWPSASMVPDRMQTFSPALLSTGTISPFPFVQFRSGDDAAPVAQGGDRVISVLFRKF